MSTQICQRAGCTVADTGICLLSHKPLESCPDFSVASDQLEDVEADSEQQESTQLPAELPDPAQRGRSFHTGLELGVEDALEISRARYCHLIAILGAWDAGKTCFLLSLYLMATRRALPKNYFFAGSLTLKGFEDRARRLRNWPGGQLPAQLADHTILSDTRQAALLHMSLRQHGPSGRRIELMLTDLPGEWSKSLVDRSSSAERFEFLQRADGVILVVDGQALNSITKHVEITRSKHLLQRLKENVRIDLSIPVTILISKGDAIGMTVPDVVDELISYAKALGFNPDVVVAAAFSYSPQVQSGAGVFEAIERSIDLAPEHIESPKAYSFRDAHRQFAAFGRGK